MFDRYAVKVGDVLVRTEPHRTAWTVGKHYVITKGNNYGGLLCIINDVGRKHSIFGLVRSRFELLQDGPW